jgi:hypothetical protein
VFKRDTQFDAENYTITVPSSSSSTDQMKTIAVFDKVKVYIEVEKDKSTQPGEDDLDSSCRLRVSQCHITYPTTFISNPPDAVQ